MLMGSATGEELAMIDSTLSELEHGPSGVLSGAQIRERAAGNPPLVSGAPMLEQQIQPNGLDLTLREVSRFKGPGKLAVSNSERRLPEVEPLPFDPDGNLHLEPGPYHIAFNEIVHLPLNIMALGRPRSSLARCGVAIHTAVWDAGYHGRSTSLLVVANPAGFWISRDARVLQLVFLTLSRAAGEGYQGAYQGENLSPARG